MTDDRRHDADDLGAALDFSVPDEAPTASGLDDRHEPVFSAANPEGSVTVTAYADSRVKQIALSPTAAAMTEAVLAEEIVILATLAARDARAAQYTYMLEEMRTRGHDDAATRDLLTRDLGLPTPQQVEAERARVFGTRYVGGHG